MGDQNPDAFPTRRSSDLAGDDTSGGKETAPSCVDTSGSTIKLGFLNSLTGGMAISEKTVSTVLQDRKSTRLNSSHSQSSYAVFCLKKKKISTTNPSSNCR